MSQGPGKYDHVCTMVREVTDATGAVVIVFDGSQGSGFSMQAPIEIQAALPDILESMAKDIRADMLSMVN